MSKTVFIADCDYITNIYIPINRYCIEYINVIEDSLTLKSYPIF